MSEAGEGCAGMAEAKRERLEQARVTYARQVLLEHHATLEQGPDANSFTVIFQDASRFHFWPYSGWFNRIGFRQQGRGIKKLLKAAGVKK